MGLMGKTGLGNFSFEGSIGGSGDSGIPPGPKYTQARTDDFGYNDNESSEGDDSLSEDEEDDFGAPYVGSSPSYSYQNSPGSNTSYGTV